MPMKVVVMQEVVDIVKLFGAGVAVEFICDRRNIISFEK